MKVVGGLQAIALQVPKGVQVQAGPPLPSHLLLVAPGLLSGGNRPGVPVEGAESRDTWGSGSGATTVPPFPQPPTPAVYLRLCYSLFSFTFLFAGGWYSPGSGRSGEPQLTRELPW